VPGPAVRALPGPPDRLAAAFAADEGDAGFPHGLPTPVLFVAVLQGIRVTFLAVRALCERKRPANRHSTPLPWLRRPDYPRGGALFSPRSPPPRALPTAECRVHLSNVSELVVERCHSLYKPTENWLNFDRHKIDNAPQGVTAPPPSEE